MNKRLIYLFALIFILVGCKPQPRGSTPVEVDVNSLRMIFNQEGYYLLDSDQLASQGFNFNSGGVITLQYRDQIIPYLTEGREGRTDGIIFYVPLPDGRYLSQQVMILEKSAVSESSTQMQSINLLPVVAGEAANLVKSSLHFEEDNEYLSKAGMDDPFLWARLDTKTAFDFSTSVKLGAVSAARLIVNLWSPSSAPVDPDHGIRITLLGKDLGSYTWEGAGPHQLELELPLADLAALQLEISTVNPDGVLAQLVYVQDIELILTHPLEFGRETFSFQSDGTLKASPALTGGYLVEIQPDGLLRNYTAVAAGDMLAWESCPGCRYDWISQESLQTEVELQPFEHLSDPFNADISVDWLVLAPQEVQSALEPLVAYRQAEGLRTLVMDPQQIYDRFFGGTPNPQALYNFFNRIQNDWLLPPKYVLMVGDFSYIAPNYAQAIKQIPAPFVESTNLGETVSDMPLMDIGQNHEIRFVIGRVPLSSPEQVALWVAKIIASEDSWKEANVGEVVAIADGQEAYFEEEARAFLALFQPPYQTSAYPIEKDKLDGGSTIARVIQDAPFMLSYFGHGSVNSWGKDQILNAESVKSLRTQVRLPLVLNMTCLSGYYIHPEQVSLAELLLQQPAGGAVSVIAPTSLTTAFDQASLYQNLALQLQNKDNERLGDVLLETWAAMDSSNPAIYEIMQSFILLGDPANRIR